MTVSYKPENIQLGEKIMKRRKELNMTAAELADQASISTVTLSGIETGRISPKFDVLHRIAFVLNKPLVLELKESEITAANAAALSGKLCQLSNGALYDDEGDVIEIHDRKLDALEDIIESMNGKPLLAAYWFKHDYDRIAKRLQSLHIPFSKLDTEDSIRKWNKGEIPVALIHPASAGHGLNFQEGGSTFVWFGLTWSLELYQQANARLWRQGQKDTVVIQHIVAKNTIDERIMKALSEKDSMQSALIEAVKAII